VGGRKNEVPHAADQVAAPALVGSLHREVERQQYLRLVAGGNAIRENVPLTGRAFSGDI
jgi:hypothetical protein